VDNGFSACPCGKKEKEGATTRFPHLKHPFLDVLYSILHLSRYLIAA
jgi:hypothetical protein